MVRLQMQFPYVKGSELYDGTKHDVDAVDCVQYGSTNIYVVEYNTKAKEKTAPTVCFVSIIKENNNPVIKSIFKLLCFFDS